MESALATWIAFVTGSMLSSDIAAFREFKYSYGSTCQAASLMQPGAEIGFLQRQQGG